MTRDLATALFLAAMTAALFVLFKLTTWALATVLTATAVVIA